MAVPYLDLKTQHRNLEAEIQAALRPVFAETQFILGPAVESFERDFAAATGCAHAVAVNTGTSALHLSLLALGVGPGDEVIVPAMTFVATAAAVAYTGATPVFADIEPRTGTIDPEAVAAAITPRTVGVIPVHLYGQPANLTALTEICEKHSLFLLEDACQAHLATWQGKTCGTFGAAGCFSFYPGKNLGAAGEGGALTTNDAALAQKCRRLRDWGQQERYRHEVLGYNYRMEGVQGAILGVKLRHLPRWTEARRAVGAAYLQKLAGVPDLTLPFEAEGAHHVFHVFAARHPERDALRTALSAVGIQTGLHYPIPLHLQPCFRKLGYKAGDFPESESLANEEVSFPIFPEMTAAQIDEVCAAIQAFAETRATAAA